MNIAQISDQFPTQATCIAQIEKARWGDTPRCPYCQSTNTARTPTRHRCYTCKTSFSVAVGTIFHHTHLPLQKWFLAVSLVLNTKKGISALQLSRDLQINKSTAGRIVMQIRKAMTQAEQRYMLTGIVKMMEKTQPLKVIAGAPDKPLIIGDIEIPCYVLEDETRVLSQRGVTSAIKLNPDVGFRMPQFLSSKALKPFISQELQRAFSRPIQFKNPVGGGTVYGYPAAILADICHAILAADHAKAIADHYALIVQRATILLHGFATVGIIALVDEATGYQRIREERALATILEKFIAKELQPWTKTFPYEFYQQIFRLKGWPGPEGVRGPRVLGHYTNDLVYERLAPGVLSELRRLNPKMPHGSRKNKHHQWFTPGLGHPKLKEHLAAVIMLMKAAPNWQHFKRSLDRGAPKLNDTLPLPF